VSEPELGVRHRTRAAAPARIACLAFAGLALVAGLCAALMLLSVAPAWPLVDRLPRVHGMLLVLGFVGTLVALERAIALGRRAGLLAPALLGLGGALLVSPAPLTAGRAALVLGSAGMLVLYLPLWRRQRDDAVLVQALGAVLAAGAAVLWLGGVAVSALLPWLVGFVVLTIGGERIELARITMRPGAGNGLVLLAGGLAASTVASLLWPHIGYGLAGLALLALVGWLARHDVARHTVRASGATRFMAGCLLAGYFWLAVAGATWLLAGPVTFGPGYDAAVHAVFLGFALSMIMAHAPVILPAVLGRPLPYHPVLIGPPALLHLSLIMRLWLGDALGITAAWRVGGILNVTSVTLFAVLAAGHQRAERVGGAGILVRRVDVDVLAAG
jgi:hypothetical protein